MKLKNLIVGGIVALLLFSCHSNNDKKSFDGWARYYIVQNIKKHTGETTATTDPDLIYNYDFQINGDKATKHMEYKRIMYIYSFYFTIDTAKIEQFYFNEWEFSCVMELNSL